MDRDFPTDSCVGCPTRVVCHCLQITETALLDAIQTLDLQTIKDVRRHTGAGDGCTCCHGRLRRCLEQVRCAPASCG
jgi:bacterioferritin-associated ferredoxin